MKKERKWLGRWPARCELCGTDLTKTKFFIDGRTVLGPWGLMCSTCHYNSGTGLGTGRGQKYDSKTLVKVEE